MPRKRKGPPYRRVIITVWNDPEVRGDGEQIPGLNLEEKAFLLYLFTNEHSHPCGLYRLPPAYVLEELGIDRRRLRSLLKKPIAPFATYDWQTKEIFVHTMARHQIDGGLFGQDKRIPWVMHHLQVIQSTTLLRAFRDRYPDWNLDYLAILPEDDPDQLMIPVSTPKKQRKATDTNKREGASPELSTEFSTSKREGPSPTSAKKSRKARKASNGAEREGPSPRKTKSARASTKATEKATEKPPKTAIVENPPNSMPTKDMQERGEASPSYQVAVRSVELPPVLYSESSERQEGDDPPVKKQEEHLHLEYIWIKVERALYAPWWHGGNGPIVLDGGKSISLGLERLLLNDLLISSDDPMLILWSIQHADRIFDWDGTTRHSLYWLKEPENMEQASGEYHKEDRPPPDDVLGTSSIGSMPKLTGRPSDSARREELRSQIRNLQADHSEPDDPLTAPGAP